MNSEPLQPTLRVKFGYGEITPEVKEKILNDHPDWEPLESDEAFATINPDKTVIKIYAKDTGKMMCLSVEMAKKWGLLS